jgi:hypothetical protein
MWFFPALCAFLTDAIYKKSVSLYFLFMSCAYWCLQLSCVKKISQYSINSQFISILLLSTRVYQLFTTVVLGHDSIKWTFPWCFIYYKKKKKKKRRWKKKVKLCDAFFYINMRRNCPLQLLGSKKVSGNMKTFYLKCFYLYF